MSPWKRLIATYFLTFFLGWKAQAAPEPNVALDLFKKSMEIEAVPNLTGRLSVRTLKAVGKSQLEAGKSADTQKISLFWNRRLTPKFGVSHSLKVLFPDAEKHHRFWISDRDDGVVSAVERPNVREDSQLLTTMAYYQMQNGVLQSQLLLSDFVRYKTEDYSFKLLSSSESCPQPIQPVKGVASILTSQMIYTQGLLHKKRLCHVIEMARNPRADRALPERLLHWIRVDKQHRLRTEVYDFQGRLLRRIDRAMFRKVNNQGNWLPIWNRYFNAQEAWFTTTQLTQFKTGKEIADRDILPPNPE